MADYTPYDDKELEVLKRDIVKLDFNVEQYDKQIQRCTDAIKEFENSIQKIKTEMLVNQHASTKVQNELISKHNKIKDKLNYENEKLNRLISGREKTAKKYIEKNETFERITGKPTDKTALKNEIYKKQEKKDKERQEKFQKQQENIQKDSFKNILELVKALSSIARNFYQTSIDIQINQMETLTKVTTEGMRAIGKGVNASLTNSLKSITTGVQEAAYSSASAALDTSFSLQEYQMNRDLNLMKMENYREVNTAKTIANSIQVGLSAVGGVIGSVVPGAGTAAGAAVGAAIGWAVGEIGQWFATITEGEAKIEEEKLQQLNELKKTALEQGMNVVNGINDFSNQIETLLGKDQMAAKNIQATIGMNTTAMEASESKLFSMQQQIGVKSRDGKWKHLGVGLEDMDKMQTAYSQITGRSIAFNLSDYNRQAQIGKVVGSQDLGIQLTAGMEIFNKSAEEGSNILWEMYKVSNRMGLDARKYSKDLVKNMKLAEKYSFKGGVQGLMKMAAWAQKVGFNMDSLDSSLQKVSEGGLEGVIKMGAEFQVLGGHVAMYADPIAMFYERYANPEAFAKRMHGMLNGLGFFNKETGEVDINGTNLMIAEQIAKIRGVSTENVLNEIRREGKRNEIDKILSPGQYNEQQRNLLASKSTYNSEKGIWEVTGADHEKHNINNLSDADFEYMAISHDENIEEYVFDIRSKVDEMLGTMKKGQTSIESIVRGEWKNQVDKRMADDENFYEKGKSQIKNLISSSMNFATVMNKQMHTTFLNSEDVFNDINSIILKNAMEFGTSIANANSEFRKLINLYKPGADNKVGGLKTEEEIAAENKVKERYEEFNNKYNRREDYLGNFSKGQGVADARAKLHSAIGDEKFAKGDYLGGIWSKLNAGASQTIGRLGQAIGFLFGVDASKVDDFLETPIFDGVAVSNNKSMSVSATSITPIHDGTAKIAKTDPKDTAIFAKTGGPFDTLFNDVFGRINAVYNMIEPLPMKYSSLAMDNSSIVSSDIGGNIKLDPLKIEISGSLDLSSGGQNINIISELQNNPILLRTLSQMLTEQVSKALNGGRGLLPINIGNV